MKKNRIIALIMVIALSMGLITGCGSNGTSKNDIASNSQKISVVCTIFPEYDWAKQIIGELGSQYELTLLLDDGVDLHNYQPTAEDISKIANCDLFIYVGGESDGWVKDALKESTNPNMQVINLLDTLGNTVKEEEVVEGMQAEVEEEASGVQKEEKEYDEHVWLSLKNAQILVTAISDALEKIDHTNQDTFKKNSIVYNEKLDILDQKYESMVAGAKHKTVLCGDRFPFRYLMDDYNIDYYAAFVGCSAETEASFDTIIFLAGKTEDLNLKSVLVIENSDQKIAKAIINNTQTKNQNILVLNSLQSTTSSDIENGVTYLSVMENNLDVLKTALTE